ncbi:uncharacterized protein LOC114269749 isoform X2 [Camellia sinensis]|uniref:uncharacterized protein LOC114269749 isoform X2 n=1 Tax=Camellia sinensis TaxID=4442 RepID=UPI001035CCCE|nr:uncharacterized protein LOC114269749 isoform X2 [Camellia sinensis]
MEKDTGVAFTTLDSLPCGIIQARLDLELKPLWSKSSSKSKVNVSSFHIFLAIPVGIKQKSNVDDIVQKRYQYHLSAHSFISWLTLGSLTTSLGPFISKHYGLS